MKGKNPMQSSLELTDMQSAAVAVSPSTRVALADIEAAIAKEYTVNAASAVGIQTIDPVNPNPIAVMTLHFIVMKNGFVVVGKSAPADAKNYNSDIGAKFAREDAMRQLWPLMGFALRDKLSTA